MRAQNIIDRARQRTAGFMAAMPLGTLLGKALAIIGVTDDRVSRLLGGKCRCPERRQWLDELSAAASRVVAGKPDAEKYFRELVEKEPQP